MKERNKRKKQYHDVIKDMLIYINETNKRKKERKKEPKVRKKERTKSKKERTKGKKERKNQK
jgi:hypothetical protein